jgi:hypothetical protein
VIAAHGIYGDSDGSTIDRSDRGQIHGLRPSAVAFLLDLERGPTGVVTALLAGVVRQLGLVATRARLQVRHRDRQVGAAIALSGVRDFPLGNTHWCDYSLSLRRGAILASWAGRAPGRDIRSVAGRDE